NSGTDTITITDDTAAPTGQSITLTGAIPPFYPGGPVTFSLTNGSDPSGGSGLDLSSAAVTRETGTLAANNCSGFTADGGTFTSPDNSTSSGHCYRYTFSIADKVGNVATSTVTAKVSPNAPTVSVDPPSPASAAGAAPPAETIRRARIPRPSTTPGPPAPRPRAHVRSSRRTRSP